MYRHEFRCTRNLGRKQTSVSVSTELSVAVIRSQREITAIIAGTRLINRFYEVGRLQASMSSFFITVVQLHSDRNPNELLSDPLMCG
ncbi:unnamed protein product [Nezara viridula]|uniref:Uncharacterized protein n=1 Tax=Nezara viridula TaxID=85310 RepID=A0A9P0HJH3_NEZVI|nr:unnamed protein product [Nezara viridula]